MYKGIIEGNHMIITGNIFERETAIKKVVAKHKKRCFYHDGNVSTHTLRHQASKHSVIVIGNGHQLCSPYYHGPNVVEQARRVAIDLANLIQDYAVEVIIGVQMNRDGSEHLAKV